MTSDTLFYECTMCCVNATTGDSKVTVTQLQWLLQLSTQLAERKLVQNFEVFCPEYRNTNTEVLPVIVSMKVENAKGLHAIPTPYAGFIPPATPSQVTAAVQDPPMCWRWEDFSGLRRRDRTTSALAQTPTSSPKQRPRIHGCKCFRHVASSHTSGSLLLKFLTPNHTQHSAGHH